jgi:hypothetical protein
MKKYFIASVVAVMAFASAAFAAQLNVNGGVLQAGVDRDLTCTQGTATVSYQTDASHDGFVVKTITVSFPDNACNGNYVNIRAYTTDNKLNMATAKVEHGKAVFNTNNPYAETVTGVDLVVKNTDDSDGEGFAIGFFRL